MSCIVFFKDKNLLPENIKKGIKIFRVVGTLEEGGQVNNEDITANSSTSSQSITYSSDYDGIGLFTLLPYVLDTKSLDPSTASQTVTSSEDGMSEVSVSAVTASIDSNIQQGNIKSGVTILGVTGTFESTGWISQAKLGTITDVSSYSLEEIVPLDYGCWMLFKDSSITNIPSLGDASVGYKSLSSCFENCTGLHSISAYIDEVYDNGMERAFYNCVNLTSVSFPYLETVHSDSFSNAFYGCSNITTLNIHPGAVSTSGNSNITSSMTGSSITHFTFSDYATSDVYISGLTSLDFDSVLDVLEHLDLNTSGYTCYFNVTVTDDVQGSIQNAYDAAENAGWTISGLTIV